MTSPAQRAPLQARAHLKVHLGARPQRHQARQAVAAALQGRAGAAGGVYMPGVCKLMQGSQPGLPPG